MVVRVCPTSLARHLLFPIFFLSLSPGLIDDGIAVFRVLGMLGHAHIVAVE
jgi:hypothetical protein